jgi:C1A family cysteine protease
MEKDFSLYRLNIRKSPTDGRDWKAKAIFREIELPVSVDFRTLMLEVRDQGDQGSCAAMAGAAVKEFQERKDVGIKDYFSPQFIYNNREDLAEEGMHMRDLMSILTKKGDCLESDYPYGLFSPPSEKVIINAANFKIKGYALVQSIDDLKTALYLNGPCVIAVPVYNYTDRMWFQRSNDNFLGGHAMCVAGYDDILKCFWIRNSWGTDFGENGYVKFPYADFKMAYEFWSCVDDKSFNSDEKILSSLLTIQVNDA